MSARRFEGTCDVCGEPMRIEIDSRTAFDVAVTEEGRLYTWSKHGHGGYDDWCRIAGQSIFSRVYEVEEPR